MPARGSRQAGGRAFLLARHGDNPTITSERLAPLDALTGYCYKRLRLGLRDNARAQRATCSVSRRRKEATGASLAGSDSRYASSAGSSRLASCAGGWASMAVSRSS